MKTLKSALYQCPFLFQFSMILSHTSENPESQSNNKFLYGIWIIEYVYIHFNFTTNFKLIYCSNLCLFVFDCAWCRVYSCVLTLTYLIGKCKLVEKLQHSFTDDSYSLFFDSISWMNLSSSILSPSSDFFPFQFLIFGLFFLLIKC